MEISLNFKNLIHISFRLLMITAEIINIIIKRVIFKSRKKTGLSSFINLLLTNFSIFKTLLTKNCSKF